MARDTKKTTTRWARLSVGYYRDPKLIEVGPIGEVAFLRLLALARETVEDSEESGTVPYVLAARELREVSDLYKKVKRGKTLDDLLAELQSVGLISRKGKSILVEGYASWQTTREEIDTIRSANKQRVAAHRAKKTGKTNNRGNEDMPLYESEVGPFEDLRDEGKIKTGGRKVGKHGLPPKQVADAEQIVEHLTKVRKEVLGGNFKVTATWWTDVKKLLNSASGGEGFTAEQVCDLIDYAMADKFWHAHCQTPAGLAKHGQKLFVSDEYIQWSLANGRPEANRPRNTLVSQKGKPSFRGKLKADEKVDWSNESGEL
jgi:hypothetical protein